jgi:hypothetical protein
MVTKNKGDYVYRLDAGEKKGFTALFLKHAEFPDVILRFCCKPVVNMRYLKAGGRVML